uniref:Uncharacterized protein n=1 Tax=Rhizophora mucronata TaxID=61149 RepID=A0A2P2R4E8_RHIMU
MKLTGHSDLNRLKPKYLVHLRVINHYILVSILNVGYD